MYIHITFEDRVNPYIKYCENEEEAYKVIEKWGMDYILDKIECNPSPYSKAFFYTAKERKKDVHGD